MWRRQEEKLNQKYVKDSWIGPQRGLLTFEKKLTPSILGGGGGKSAP